MIYLVIYLIISIGLIVYTYRTAPVGYEDETGFHYGERK